MIQPGFGGEGDEGEVVGNAEAFAGEPGNGGEDLSRAGRHDGGGRGFELEAELQGAGDAGGFCFVDHAADGAGSGSGFDGLGESLLGGLESGELGLGHEKADVFMAVSFQKGAGVEGGGFPVEIDTGEGDVFLGVSADEAGDLFFLEPLLDGGGALVENPGIGFDVFDELFEFAGGVFDMEKAG